MKTEAWAAAQEQAIIGCLLGTAVGDAVGLACEGLSRRRQTRLFPHLDGPRLLGRRGMVSDDTEHTCLIAQALIESAGEPEAFPRALARRLRVWLLGLPAGVGWATLRATLKLCVGVPPSHSGVPSAGNGPAMRSALLGVCYGNDPARLRALVKASARLTHTDPRAEVGALAVALAAHLASEAPADLPGTFLYTLDGLLWGADAGFLDLARRVADSVHAGETTQTFAASLGAEGYVSGYVYQTVPVVLHAWLCFPRDYRQAFLSVVHCGGDTDTTGAIVGAIVGAAVGQDGIPAEWRVALWEWPRTVAWMTRLGAQLAAVCADGQPQRPLSLPFLPLLARNLVFAAVVLTHGFRRLLPPY